MGENQVIKLLDNMNDKLSKQYVKVKEYLLDINEKD
jgi:hypothetical protein